MPFDHFGRKNGVKKAVFREISNEKPLFGRSEKI